MVPQLAMADVKLTEDYTVPKGAPTFTFHFHKSHFHTFHFHISHFDAMPGSIVIPSLWSACHEGFPNPESFDPERMMCVQTINHHHTPSHHTSFTSPHIITHHHITTHHTHRTSSHITLMAGRPERQEDVVYRNNFLTFGVGPHMCVGREYAINQLTAFLSILATKAGQ